MQEWVVAHNHTTTTTRFYQDDPLPDPHSLDWLVVMGGPMGANDDDQYPWLQREKRFIEQAIAADKVVLGICLGAQLIADVLGARVYPNQHRELGWFPIERTDAASTHPIGQCFPPSLDVFHWHGDTFDLPDGAVHLARNDGCEHQAFVYDQRVVGLQFHMEVTLESIQALIHHCADEIGDGPYMQTPDAMLNNPAALVRANQVMGALLDHLHATS